MLLPELAEAIGDGLGGSDCELLRDEALAQPVNALTSVAYVVIGVVVIARAAATGRALRAALVYGTCLVGIGLGSVSFHGPQPDGARILHDLPILLTVLFIAVHDVALISRRVRRPMSVFTIGAGVATALTVIDPDLGTVTTGLGVIVIVVLELVVVRRGLRAAPTRRPPQWHVTIIVIGAIAAATWLLGRTGSPACNPDGVFQFHGLWHVISALVLGLWWWLAFVVGRTQPNDDARSRDSNTASDR